MSDGESGLGMVVSLLAGGFFAGSYAFFVGLPPNEVKIYETANQPTVMRIYNPGRDKILVKDGDNHYNPLTEHLKIFNSIPDRKIEEMKILKTVGWYE